MAMVEPARQTPASSRGLAHAGEVAHWTVVLLAWLWLGEQGALRGGPWASGVLAVALWWAARLLSRGRAWAQQASAWAMGMSGLMTACSLWLADLLALHGAAQEALLVVALCWGLWTGAIETRSRVSTFQLGPIAWHPVMAAALVGGVWSLPSGMLRLWAASGLLVACAAALYARDRAMAEPSVVCRGPQAALHHLLPSCAMGLMMGSLWLGNAWCAALPWTTQDRLWSHLALMAVLPAGVACLLRLGDRARLPAVPLVYVCLGFLAVGTALPWGDSAAQGWLAMLLPSLAWSVHCCRQRLPKALSARTSPSRVRAMALLLGPGMLVWVGVASAVQGPWAIQAALGALGFLAALQLALWAWRAHAPRLRWSPSSH